MTYFKIENVFTNEELDLINNALLTYQTELDERLGRAMIGDIKRCFPNEMRDKVEKIASEVSGLPLIMDHALYVEYNKKYGTPNLPPHFDGDTNDLIINYQLSANTSWGLGLNLDVYNLEDNSAVVFNGNTEIHWRPHKQFKEGEYVKMIFIRFYNSEKRSNYSNLTNDPMDDIFKEVRDLRDGLT